jgi:hypothetical protein
MKTLIVIVSIGFFFISCEKDRYIEKVGMVQIENCSITDTVFINEIATIAIRASTGNGCWSNLFVDFEKTDVYEYSIKAYGTFSCYEDGCTCPTVMVYHDTLITFQPNQIGMYLFQIQKNINMIKTDTLIVK